MPVVVRCPCRTKHGNPTLAACRAVGVRRLDLLQVEYHMPSSRVIGSQKLGERSAEFVILYRMPLVGRLQWRRNVEK